MNVPAALTVGLAGAVLTALAATALGMDPIHAAELAGLAGLAALLAGLLGAGVLYVVRGCSLGVQATVASLTTVAAVGAGALSAARAMFLSGEALEALVVVMIAAGTVGMIAALILGGRVRAASGALGAAARRIGTEDWQGSAGMPPTRELAGLARELEAMSVRLEEARGRERALDASRRELIAWVSHDLRTPLAGIRATAEALEDGVVSDPETVARYHRTLRCEAERLAGLVDDLFELSRINAGALQLQMERVPLLDLVSDALAAADPVASAKGVRLEGRLTAETPELELSPAEISRVFRNLLENAIRHTPRDGTVRMEVGLTDGHAVVTVADACGGIPEQDLARVFDLAFRGEPARTPEGGAGAGLGLAIARGIVEAHRGEIDVRNVDAGCCFTVRLPLSQPA